MTSLIATDADKDIVIDIEVLDSSLVDYIEVDISEIFGADPKIYVHIVSFDASPNNLHPELPAIGG